MEEVPQEQLPHESRDSSEALTKPGPKPAMSSFALRTISTVVLFALMIATMWGGNIPVAVTLLLFQILMVKELFQLARNAEVDKTMPLFRTQQWYFFGVANFFLYGRFLRRNFYVTGVGVQSSKFLSWLLYRHLLVSYAGYTFGLVVFVLTLQPNKYAYQFKQLAWTHLIVFFTIVPTSFFMPLIFQGLIWFLLPCLQVIVNDIMAYVAGKAFGRTPLIKLSPKKTWEGFIGGAIGTMLVSLPLSWALSRFPWFYCPREELSMGPLQCFKPAAFIPVQYRFTDLWEVLPRFLVEEVRGGVQLFVPNFVRTAIGHVRWTCMPVQMHSLPLALFASVIGPFGGFFASGFKRAFGIKDFGQSIPGHGGVTDRFDCQTLMAVFAYLYLQSYVFGGNLEEEVWGGLMDLPQHAHLKFFIRLGSMLVANGFVPREPFQQLIGAMQEPWAAQNAYAAE